MKVDFLQARQNMIDCQIRPFSVTDEHVIQAFFTVARENFVSDHKKSHAYTDDHLDLEQGRFLMDAAISARLFQALEIKQGDQVLDLGCGCGYSSTILSLLGGHVTAVDTKYWIDRAMDYNTASNHRVMRWVAVEQLNRGCPEYGPFDRIVINGCLSSIPHNLADQLREGGKIATIYRDEQGVSQAVLFIKNGEKLICQPLFDAICPDTKDFKPEEQFVF